jgi:hypothetical protein
MADSRWPQKFSNGYPVQREEWVRRRVRSMGRIYATLITEQDWKNFNVRRVNNGDSGISKNR